MLQHKGDLLLVEDDPQLRIVLCAILTQCGYAVRSAHDGLSGLAEVWSRVPDVILSDLYMPGMSGFDFLAEVRKTFPAIPLIAMSSAYSGTAVPPGVTADCFYEKATSVDHLLVMVENRCSGALLRTEPAVFSREAAIAAKPKYLPGFQEQRSGGQ